jgi:hypothetical protein
MSLAGTSTGCPRVGFVFSNQVFSLTARPLDASIALAPPSGMASFLQMPRRRSGLKLVGYMKVLFPGLGV